MESKSNVLFIVEVAISAALAAILDLFSFSAWGQGESISLQMVPVFIMAFRWGLRGGLTTGFIFGLLQLISGHIINPIQGLLDYPIAFTLVGLAAIVTPSIQAALKHNNKTQLIHSIVVGCLIGSLSRLVIHILSAIIYFSDGIPSNQSIIWYSISYNGSYVLPSFLISVILIIIITQTRNEILIRNGNK